MKKIAVLGLASVALAGCGIADKLHMGPSIQGSGNAKTETRALESFDQVSVAGSPTVIWTKGDKPSAKVTVDDNLLEHLKTEVSNGQLKIYFKGNVTSRSDIRIEIQSPNVTGVSLSGSGSFKAEGIAADRFEVTVTGSGEVDVKGKAKRVDATVTGSGELTLTDLVSEDVKASVTGSGEAFVHATSTLEASITGSGRISYAGEPKVDKSITGSGEVISAR